MTSISKRCKLTDILLCANNVLDDAGIYKDIRGVINEYFNPWFDGKVCVGNTIQIDNSYILDCVKISDNLFASISQNCSYISIFKLNQYKVDKYDIVKKLYTHSTEEGITQIINWDNKVLVSCCKDKKNSNVNNIQLWNIDIDSKTFGDCIQKTILCTLDDMYPNLYLEKVSCEKIAVYMKCRNKTYIYYYNRYKWHNSNQFVCPVHYRFDFKQYNTLDNIYKTITSVTNELTIYHKQTGDYNSWLYIKDIYLNTLKIIKLQYKVASIYKISDTIISVICEKGGVKLFDIDIESETFGDCIKSLQGHIDSINYVSSLSDNFMIGYGNRIFNIWNINKFSEDFGNCVNIILDIHFSENSDVKVSLTNNIHNIKKIDKNSIMCFHNNDISIINAI